MLALFGAGAIAAFCAGCLTPIVTNPEEDMPGAENIYRRMPGSTARIFAECKNVLDRLGFKVVSVRENAAINARLEAPRRSIHAFLKILGGDRLYIRLYTLDGQEKDEWMTRLYREIKGAILGTPAQREKRGRPGRG